jgi:hypothetical protein
MNKAQIMPIRKPAYTPQELGEELGVSANTIRRWVRNEPGVLRWGRPESKPGKKRAHLSLRIPAEVADRLRRRMTNI